MDDQQPQKRSSSSMADTMRTVGALSTVGFSFVFAIAIGAFLYFAPKVLRLMKARIWLAFTKLNSPAASSAR